jgi:hypothetical protein
VAHVFYSAGNRDVNLPPTDSRSQSCHGRHPTSTHSINRKPWYGRGQSRRESDRSSQGQALLAFLSCGRNGNIVDFCQWNRRISGQKPAKRVCCDVVGTHVAVNSLCACATKRAPHSVNVENVIGHADTSAGGCSFRADITRR